jgi:hypothetical protein
LLPELPPLPLELPPLPLLLPPLPLLPLDPPLPPLPAQEAASTIAPLRAKAVTVKPTRTLRNFRAFMSPSRLVSWSFNNRTGLDGNWHVRKTRLVPPDARHRAMPRIASVFNRCPVIRDRLP